MYNTIRNPGFAQGFNTLAQALAPNPQARINADLAAKRRDQIMAETAIKQQQLTDLQTQATAQNDLRSLLTSGADLNDPANRSRMMGYLSGVPEGLQYGPKFATGATTFVNPGTFDDNQLANVLMATGTPYQNTKPGVSDALASAQTVAAGNNQSAIEAQRIKQQSEQAQSSAELANALRIQDMKNQNDFAVQQSRNASNEEMNRYRVDNPYPNNGAPIAADLKDTQALWDEIDARLNQQFDGKFDSIDPQLQQAMRSRVTERYQQTRSMERAVYDTLQDFDIQRDVHDTWLPFDKTVTLRGQRRAPAQAPTRQAAPAQQAAPAGPAPANANEGDILRAKNGSTFVVRSGQLYPYGG
ncbi:hypothetical protein [uncultured Cohaesibacter sp.]|uniref:hypothetical protein n=1 Tax=uncultured Cohaesibacter sp. TaxID=1002546 RepID=UPI0029C95495|nr:hypothetical protein [uncultured Cohaesibacter sp.]